MQLIMFDSVQRHFHRRKRHLPNLTRPESTAVDKKFALCPHSSVTRLDGCYAAIALDNPRHRTVFDNVNAERPRLGHQRFAQALRIADTVVGNPQATNDIAGVDERRPFCALLRRQQFAFDAPTAASNTRGYVKWLVCWFD